MKQYIYGNIEKKGYIYLSSDPQFFLDPQKAQAMPHLVCYDTTCLHGDLPAGEHQCYWMLTTDLNIPGEEPHLFLQASGFHPDRGATYAHGFISEADDRDLYGPGLLELMKTQFKTGQQVLQLKTTDHPQSLCVDQMLRDDTLELRLLPQKTLELLLNTLLQGRKLILQLPQTGQAALTASRQLLLTLYARLPYAQRRTNGFATGMSSHKILDTANTLPAAITICLMDGDADAAGLPPLGTDYFVLSEDGQLHSGTGKPVPPVRSALPEYLASESVENLDGFFAFCQQLTQLVPGNFTPNVNNYELFHFFYTLGSQSGAQITDEQIRLCAANLYGADAKIKNLKAELYRRVAGVLSPRRLAEYLCKKAQSYADLAALGIPDPQEQRAILSGNIDKVTDTHAALTMRMAQTYYTSAEDIEALLQPLAERFQELACQEMPCLDEKMPTARTVQELNALQLGDTAGSNLKEQLINRVHAVLRSQKAAVLSKYEENRRVQLQEGTETIRACSLAYTTDSLQELYGLLAHRYYLFPELISSWNTAIGEKLAGACLQVVPETVAACGTLLQTGAHIRELYQSQAGSVPQVLEEAQREQMALWHSIWQLYQQPCPGVSSLLRLLEQMDGIQMPCSIAQELRDHFAEQISVDACTDEEICSCADRLARKLTQEGERELLVSVLCRCLSSMAPDLPLDSLKTRLEIARKLENAGFLESVDFQPWQCTDTPTHLARMLAELENYSSGNTLSALENPTVRRWAIRNLQKNAELIYWLAVMDAGLGRDVLDWLAKHYLAMQPSKLEKLYLAGWARQDLLAAGGKQASVAWKSAMDTLFPKWTELPAPAFAKPTASESKHPIRFGVPTALMAVAGLLPVGMAAALGFLTFPLTCWSAGVLAAAAAICLAAACLPLQPDQKKLLRRFALALLPGIVAAVIMSLLIIMAIL